MLQGPAAYLPAPVYGHSHYKKFWLKKMETEDEPAAETVPSPSEGDGGVVLMKKPLSYAVNCSALDMKMTSPPSAAIRAVAPAAEKIKYVAQKSEFDYTLALGVGLSMQEREEEEEDGSFSSREEKFNKFALHNSAAVEQEYEHPNPVYLNSNGHSPRAVAKMCADCKTVKTPLWRNGPQGPKSLCNACGIRYKKMGKRPSSNGERPSSPSTPPISPSGKNKIHGKRKRERDIYSRQQQDQHHLHQRRKKMKNIGGGRLSMGPRCLQSEVDSAYVGDGNRSGEALRRWRQVERIRKGLLRYGKMMNSMAKDEEEGAVLLMALSCGVASC